MSPRPVKPTHRPTPGPRRYNSPKRDQAARHTRQRIRASAEELFLRDGYIRTTTKAIARQAGVAEMTLFNAFPTKAALLSEIIRVNVRGDDHDQAMVTRTVWQNILGAPPDQILPRFAEFNGNVLERTARVRALAEAAADTDPDLAIRRDSSHAHLRSDVQQIADALAATGTLPDTVTPQQAGDTLYAIANETTYLRLVDECHWSTTRYICWLTKTLQSTLTRPHH